MSTPGRPWILDLFCGAGGAAMGYHLAGFDVVGVDIAPQPHYPFEFRKGDALEFLLQADLSQFGVIHASPPCQFATKMNATHRKAGHDYQENLLTPTIKLLDSQDLPYVVENVPAAKYWMDDYFTLHGGHFGLRVYRPRIFRSSLDIEPPPRAGIPAEPVGVYGLRPMSGKQWDRLNGNMKGKRSPMRIARSVAEAQDVMQMPWAATWDGLKEAVPPPYTEYIGRQLIQRGLTNVPFPCTERIRPRCFR